MLQNSKLAKACRTLWISKISPKETQKPRFESGVFYALQQAKDFLTGDGFGEYINNHNAGDGTGDGDVIKLFNWD